MAVGARIEGYYLRPHVTFILLMMSTADWLIGAEGCRHRACDQKKFCSVIGASQDTVRDVI